VNLAQFVTLVPFLFVLLGLTLDGGQLLVARRDAQSVADAAARAGAGELAIDVVRTGQDGPPPLDVLRAQDAAEQYVDVQPSGLQTSIDVEPERVVVQVTSRPVQFILLRIMGVTGMRVRAVGVASPRTGVVAPE
jgi:Flp pilus assembly protein TadG